MALHASSRAVMAATASNRRHRAPAASALTPQAAAAAAIAATAPSRAPVRSTAARSRAAAPSLPLPRPTATTTTTRVAASAAATRRRQSRSVPPLARERDRAALAGVGEVESAALSGGRRFRARSYMLEWAVTPATAAKYRRHVKEFIDWVDANHYDEGVMEPEEFDEVLLDYIHHLYESDRGKSTAATTLYGCQLYCPQLRLRLPRSAQAVRGWMRQSPAAAYPPLTWELAAAIAVELTRAGEWRMGFGVVVAFDCFLRVGELCALTREDVADSGDARLGSEHSGVLLRLRTTKTGTNQWVRVLDADVILAVRALVAATPVGGRLFPFSPATFRRQFHTSCAVLGLSPRYVPHSLRHGGATRYRHVLGWSVEDVMERGRWASSKSARRYIQSGPALLMAMAAPARVVAVGGQLVKDLFFCLSLAQRH